MVYSLSSIGTIGEDLLKIGITVNALNINPNFPSFRALLLLFSLVSFRLELKEEILKFTAWVDKRNILEDNYNISM